MRKIKSLVVLIFFPFIGYSQSNDPALETAIVIDSTIFHADATYLNNLVDYSSFVRKVFRHYDLSQQDLIAYEETFSNELSIGDIIIAQTGEFGEFHFLKITEYDKRKALLFRQLDDDHWLNYLYITYQEDSDRIWVDDIFMADVGMWVSEIVETAIGIDSSIPMKNETYRKRMLQMDSMFIYNENANYDRSLGIYQEMSSFYQQKKPVMIAAIMAASLGLKGNSFGQLVSKYQILYPYDISLYLNLLEINERLHKGKETINVLDMLDEIVGGDPYLYYRKAENYTKSGYFSKAEKICKKLVKQESLVIESKLLIMECNYWKGEYKNFLKELLSLSEILNVKPDSIFNEGEYVEFFNSDVWKTYSSAHE